MATLRLGIDYGTSTSKLVFRDAAARGGEKAFLMCWNGDCRISSSVGFDGRTLYFGQLPNARFGWTWYESVKMRVAAEVKDDYARYFAASRSPLPHGICAMDLATLTVWYLRSRAQEHMASYMCGHAFSVAVTLGLPMSFFQDGQLQAVFLEIAQTAARVYQRCGPLKSGELDVQRARNLLDQQRTELEECGADELRNWIRAEAEAAMAWAVRSPAVPDGPYAKIDIGAGTTNASVFSIVPRHTEHGWIKERLCFFGAWSVPVGMDAFDRALARGCRFQGDPLQLRGRENDHITPSTLLAVSPCISSMWDAYYSACLKANQCLNQAERDRFAGQELFLIGGGSLIRGLPDLISRHPTRHHKVPVHAMELPYDLHREDNQALPVGWLPFSSVAYGLSIDAMEFPNPSLSGEWSRAEDRVAHLNVPVYDER